MNKAVNSKNSRTSCKLYDMSKKSRNEHTAKQSNRAIKVGASWVIGLGAVLAAVYFVGTAPKVPASEYLSTTGLHYHPHITITVNGENVPVPPNIGIGAVHNPIHTHEADSIIHLEFEGRVKKSDTNLGKFFALWGKEWTATSFMGYPIDATHKLIMKVDGVESTEYGDLLMKDKQQIELIYQ